MGTKLVGDHLSMEIEIDGDRLSRGINFMGIIRPGGQEVGDRKSRDQMGSAPNASQPTLEEYPEPNIKLIYLGVLAEMKSWFVR